MGMESIFSLAFTLIVPKLLDLLCLKTKVRQFEPGAAIASAIHKAYCCCALCLAKKNFCGASKSELKRNALRTKRQKRSDCSKRKIVKYKKRETDFGLP